MKNASFQCSTSASISASDAIKKISEIPQWWAVSFDGHSEKKNDKFVIKMGDDSFFDFTVKEYSPNKRLVWSINDCHMPWFSDPKEWSNTQLIFELYEKEGITTLSFTHEGLTPKLECYKNCALGWTHWITKSLYSYFTKGIGDFNKNFHTTIEVNASAEETMKRISQVDKWWAKKVKGKTNHLNDKFTADFGSTYVDFQIREWIPNKKIVWKVTDCNLDWINHKKEWNGTDVVFEITEKGKSTQINFTHIGLVPGVECYNDCEAGWTDHITKSLVNFINEGEGQPV